MAGLSHRFGKTAFDPAQSRRNPPGTVRSWIVSWATYLVSSVAWLVYGIRQKDALICLTNAGWIGLDAAIVAGLVLRH